MKNHRIYSCSINTSRHPSGFLGINFAKCRHNSSKPPASIPKAICQTFASSTAGTSTSQVNKEHRLCRYPADLHSERSRRILEKEIYFKFYLIKLNFWIYYYLNKMIMMLAVGRHGYFESSVKTVHFSSNYFSNSFSCLIRVSVRG